MYTEDIITTGNIYEVTFQVAPYRYDSEIIWASNASEAIAKVEADGKMVVNAQTFAYYDA